MITVVGLDLSLTSTGLSCSDNLSVIRSTAKSMERLHHIETTIMDVVNAQTNPVVVVEGYSFASRHSHAHALGELGGVVRLALWRADVPYVDVPPTVRAKFATGRGNAGKNEVMSAVSARTGLVWSGSGADDLCDAWLLEESGRCMLSNSRFEWPKTHLDALSKVDWSPLLAKLDKLKNGE